MPLKNFDDTPHRFRPPASAPPRPSIDMPMNSAGRSNFPAVGAALPVQQFSTGTYQRSLPNDNRPRVSAAWAASPPVNVAAAPLPKDVPKKRSAKKKRRLFTKWRIIFVVLLIAVILGGWFVGKMVSNTLKVFSGNVFSILTTTKLKGEDSGRVNILLAGNSADDVGHDGANLTDSIMIISVDTVHHTAFMLSVPRDLWVDIPGYGHAKINEAYVDGQAGNFSAPGYPNGGMGLLEEVIQNNFGISMQYYALINYNALRDSVNAVGGIDVNIQSEDPRGLYDPSIDYATHGPLVKLTNGTHHLNGEQALDLARARGDAYGAYGYPRADFDRTQNQRMMLLALKTRVLSLSTFANPITISSLFDTIGKNVKTNFTLSEARRAYDLSKTVDNAKIVSASLNDAAGKNLLESYASPNGESALIPAQGVDSFGQIQQYVRNLMTNDPVAHEAASIVVLNATDTSGLAAKVETALQTKHLNIVSIGDARTKEATTTIIDASAGKKPATLALLKQRYGANVSTVNPYKAVYTADFIVVLGADQVPQTTPSTQ